MQCVIGDCFTGLASPWIEEVDVREAAIGRRAERQFGVFSGSQAIDAGFNRRSIRRFVQRGAWLRVVGDTYRLAGGVESWRQPIVGAYLAAGEPSAVSGLAALPMWEMGKPPKQPELTIPVNRHFRRTEVRVTRTRRWSSSEMVRFGPLRITSKARTLLDVAPRLELTQLEIALDAAHRAGLELRSFAEYVERAVKATIPGAALLAELVASRDPDRPIETEAETMLFAVLRRGGLPLPVPQYWVQTRTGRKRVDFAYPDKRVAIEFDSYEWHGAGRRPFDEHYAKDNELADIAWGRRHITWTMLRTEPAEVMFTVGRAIDLEPCAWRPSR